MITVEEYTGKRAHVLRSLTKTGVAEPLALAKSSSNLFRHRAPQRVHQLDLRDFNHVLRINEQERYAEVEGLTTYEELVRETLAFNLMPAVLPPL